MMLGCPGQPASQAEAAARAVQGPRASGRVRRLNAVDSRVNGHKAIHKAKHLLLREEGDIYYLKKRKTERHKEKHRERQRHMCTHQETGGQRERGRES